MSQRNTTDNGCYYLLRARWGHEQGVDMARNHWGKVRKLPSGKFQASYIDPITKKRVNAPLTFDKLTPARAWLSAQQTKVIEQAIIPEARELAQVIERGKGTTLGEFAAKWRSTKRKSADKALKPRTVAEYERYMKSPLKELAGKPIGEITSHDVRAWWDDYLSRPHGRRLGSSSGANQASKVYAHLKTLMSAAVEQGYIPVNPCRLGSEASYRRDDETVPTRDQVAAMLEAAPPHWRALIELAAYGCLRRGEALALERASVVAVGKGDTRVYRVVISRSMSKGIVTSTKSDQARTVTLPPRSTPILDDHLKTMPDDSTALLFPNYANGSTNWQSFIPDVVFQKIWDRIRTTAGYPGTFHSLRAFGLTVFGETGATLAQIMRRGGHSNQRTAMRYQRDIGTDDEKVLEIT